VSRLVLSTVLSFPQARTLFDTRLSTLFYFLTGLLSACKIADWRHTLKQMDGKIYPLTEEAEQKRQGS
jgi:hypothetical protein